MKTFEYVVCGLLGGILIACLIALTQQMKAEDFVKYYDATVACKDKEKATTEKQRTSYHWTISPVNSKLLEIISWVEDSNHKESNVQTNYAEVIKSWSFPFSDPKPATIMLCSNYDTYHWKGYEMLGWGK